MFSPHASGVVFRLRLVCNLLYVVLYYIHIQLYSHAKCAEHCNVGGRTWLWLFVTPHNMFHGNHVACQIVLIFHFHRYVSVTAVKLHSIHFTVLRLYCG